MSTEMILSISQMQHNLPQTELYINCLTRDKGAS